VKGFPRAYCALDFTGLDHGLTSGLAKMGINRRSRSTAHAGRPEQEKVIFLLAPATASHGQGLELECRFGARGSMLDGE